MNPNLGLSGGELDFLKRSAVRSEAQSATLWIILGCGVLGALISTIIRAVKKPKTEKFLNADYEEKLIVGTGSGLAFGLLVAIIVYSVRAAKLYQIEKTHTANYQSAFEGELTRRQSFAEKQPII